MTRRAPSDAARDVEVLLREGAVGRLSDAELVRRFASRRDDGGAAAFAALVDRHGPMVLGVCRRILRDPHDVDDAFQTTFLVLARKAGAVRVGDSLGPWLYGVCRRVAVRARETAARREAREARARGVEAGVPAADPARAELLAALVDEVARLPEKYRAAVALCDLAGMTHEAAARRLGCPVGTVESRLSRSRERLRTRLTRRGFAPGAVAAGLAAPDGSASAAVPTALAEATVRNVTAGAVPAAVGNLTREVLRAMFFGKLRTVAVGILAAGALTMGVAAIARQAPADRPAGVPPRGDAGSAENSKRDKDDTFDRMEDLRLDIALLLREIDTLVTMIGDTEKDLFSKSIGFAGLKADTPEATESLKLKASEEIRAMREGLQELRKNYNAKREELAQKRKELDALQRSRRAEVDRPEQRRGAHELERLITEMNQKLDRILKALEDSKRDRER